MLKRLFGNEEYRFGQRIAIILFVLIALFQGWAIYHNDTTLYTAAEHSRFILVLDIFMAVCCFFSLSLISRVSFDIFVPVIYYFITRVFAYIFPGWDVLGMAVLIMFMLINNNYKRHVFRIYRLCIIGISMIGIICYVAYVFSLPIPYENVRFYSVGGSQYINYGVSFLWEGAGVFLRLCGIFNEPGYLGTIVALVLCVDGIDLKKKGNWILLIAGFLSFSMAFWMIISIYLVLKVYEKPKIFIPLLLFFLFVFFILPNLKIENATVINFISRIGVDNRTNALFDEKFQEWLSSSKVFWGYGYGYGNGIGVSSYKRELVNYGVIGFALIFGSLLFCALKRASGKMKAYFLVICFFVSIYQRPNVFNMLYFIILFGGIEYIHFKEEIHDTKL